MNKKDKLYPVLEAEYRKIYGGRKDEEEMVNYSLKKLSGAIQLSCGIFVWDKESIHKDFCFGWGCQSAYDYDEASEAARETRKSETYLFNRNMASIQKFIDDFNEHKDELYWRGHYMPEFNCNIIFIGFIGPYTYDYADFTPEHKINAEDIKLISEFMANEKVKREKQVRTYIKRFGTSKVRTWTYWADE